MTTKDEVRSTVEALRTERALKLALETAEGIAGANWREWHELASPEEFERWVKSRATHMAVAIRVALASKSEALAAVPETHKQSAEIPQSITCPFCESQHVPGWLHDYNMDRMKKPAPVAEPHEQQSAERVEPVAVVRLDAYNNYAPHWINQGYPKGTLLYTAPQPRQWVGLTDAEVDDLQSGLSASRSDVRAIEAKLREKNE